ncbi:glycosyltransferase [Rhizobium sp. 16-545-1B]|nr:glycosyltransferase [Rhizobium sp. 16-488-2b]
MNELTQTALSFTGERYVPEIEGNIFLEHMHRYLLAGGHVAGKDILDIASGEGFGSFFLARTAASVVGVDISAEAVAHAQSKYVRENLHFKIGSAASIPLENHSVDVVVSFETIEHHDQHEEMMKEIKRVLRPGGRLIISSPEKHEYSDVPGFQNPFHVKELYRDEFLDLVGRHFSSFAIYGQRVIFGSGIFLEGQSSGVVTYDSKTFEASPGVRRPIYLIAIASDGNLGALSDSSFFEQQVLESEIVNIEITAREGMIALHERTIKALREEAAAREQMFLSSMSWKITKPLRLARRLTSDKREAARMALSLLPSPAANVLRKLYHHIVGLPATLVNSGNNIAALNALVEERNAMNAFALPPMMACLQSDDLPEVDISVVTYNSEKWISGFVSSLGSLSYPKSKMHVFFVDNESQDNTLEMLAHAVDALEKMGISARVLRRPNKGFGAGHNAGISSGSSPFCLVTNVDLVFEPDSLTKATSHAVSDHSMAAAWEFRQKPYEHPKHYDPVSGTTNWNSHACVLIRRSAFEDVGGYCDDLFMYGEDVELSYRLRSQGYKLRFSPHAVVYHYTYEAAGQVKPLQVTGSTFANLYMRLAFGTLRDMIAVPAMGLRLLVSAEQFPGARRKHFQNAIKLIQFAPKLITRNVTRKTAALFPFRGWDYELVRKGAFYALDPLPDYCPKVTVITRSYKGREKLLLQAMKSVSNQTYRNIEHIITEDRGEHLKDFIEEYAAATGGDIVYASGNKIGRSDAGNLALEKATGRWCVFLDDDDLFYCDHIEVLVGSILKNNSHAAYSLAFEVPTRKLAEDWSSFAVFAPIIHDHMAKDFDYEALKSNNLFPIQAVLFERTLFEERGGFDEDLEALEDWALWQKYSYRTRFVLAAKTTSLYRTPEHLDDYDERRKKLVSAYEGLVERMDSWRARWDRR